MINNINFLSGFRKNSFPFNFPLKQLCEYNAYLPNPFEKVEILLIINLFQDYQLLTLNTKYVEFKK